MYGGLTYLLTSPPKSLENKTSFMNAPIHSFFIFYREERSDGNNENRNIFIADNWRKRKKNISSLCCLIFSLLSLIMVQKKIECGIKEIKFKLINVKNNWNEKLWRATKRFNVNIAFIIVIHLLMSRHDSPNTSTSHIRP